MAWTDYTVLNDKNLPLCFVGNTQYNHMLFNDLKNIRDCKLLTVEEVLDQSTEWRDKHQFFSASATICFKKFVAEKLINVHWVSIVGRLNAIHTDVSIGHNVFIHYFNSFHPGSCIGSHCTVTTHCVVGHRAIVKDFCHVSPYVSLHYVDLGAGCCVGMRTTITGQSKNSIAIAEHTNILISSCVRKTILETGTYFNHKKIDSLGSCDRSLVK